jgi:23S rRNA-/tRNA-specific pseudouridylate synthase
VNGVPVSESGRVTHPIAEGRRSRRVIRPEGKASATRWEVLERFPGAGYPLAPPFEGAGDPIARTPGHAWIRCEPETGRTHQIRVHLASLGLPIVADPFYDFSGAEPVAPRCALHAAAAAWEMQGRRFRVEAPLPADLADALTLLRANRS